MRLQDEGESSNPDSYAPGGLVVGIDGSDTVGVYIGRHEPVLSAEDLLRMFRASLPQGYPWEVPQSVPGVQGEMIGFAAPMSTWYDNKSDHNRAYRLNIAIDRDARFNYEEQIEYDRTLAELQFGSGFFLRAHP